MSSKILKTLVFILILALYGSLLFYKIDFNTLSVNDLGRHIKNGEVLVRETILKDNDCGISKENMMRKVGALEKVRHMNAKVYRQVQKLADYVRTAEGDRYFESELRIGHENFDSSTKSHNIRNNIITAAKILRENCESGRLNLDLDLEGLMADPNYKESCRVN